MMRYVLGVAGLVTFSGFQSPAEPQGTPPSSADRVSSEILGLQRELERQRRDHLPVTTIRYGGCDVRIGTDCYWLAGEEKNPNRPDHETVVTMREELLERLYRAAPGLRDSPWLHGTIVRYEIERDNLDAALSSTNDCGEEIKWWCAALRGYAYHLSDQFDQAEAAFDTALTLMDPPTRCEWSDLSPLLEGPVRSAYGKTSCDDRESLQARILWLADPLYATAGNELWTDHMARHVWSQLTRDSETAYRKKWDRNTHRGIIRYGLPAWWSKEPVNSRTGGVPSVIWHHESESQHLFPVELSNPVSEITLGDWEPHLRLPESWHAVGPGMQFSDQLSHDVSRFPRWNGQVVVVTVDLSDDDLIAGATNRLGVYLSPGPEGETVSADRSFTRATALLLNAPSTGHLISIEVTDRAMRHARRARFGLSPLPVTPGSISVSDIMIVESGPTLPGNLQSAVSRYRPNNIFQAGQAVDLYWEVLVAPANLQSVNVSLSLERVNRSPLRRLWERTPFAGPARPVILEWVEPLQTNDGIFPWGLTISLPENIDPGSYRISLKLQGKNGEQVVRERTIQVVN